MTDFWKVYSRDLCPPMQGGDPAWDGSLPATITAPYLDTSEEDCAPGLHFCTDLATAFRIAGLWRNGYPARAFLVEPDETAITRGEKLRAASITILREATEAEIEAAVLSLSQPYGALAADMAAEQMAWRAALARPQTDIDAVEAGLRAALDARGLSDWPIRRFDSTGAAWDVRAAWDAWDTWDAWATWDTWDARGAWDARATRATRATWATWDTWDARGAWGAWDGLTVRYAALMGWTKVRPDLLTVGVREAYAAGMAIALPTGPNELGYAMEAH